MSCVVVWQPAQDYVYSDSAGPGLSAAKKLSFSLGDLTKETKKTRDIGVTLGTYFINASKKIKAPAPPPPMQSTSKPQMEHMSSTESEGTGNEISEESKENLLHRKVDLTIYFPDGQEKPVTVDGSKAVMDFLVDLCSQHHLNPVQHTLEVRSGVSQQPLTLRPNTLIGILDVESIFLKEKVTEVKVRKPPPKIPEKTIRLVVNFLGTQKAVVRVNPAVPLRNILPAVCEKCELSQENVTLLRDAISKEELNMSRSLNELGIKELYAWSSKQEKNRNLSSNSDTTEKEKKGIFGFFRSNKKVNKNEGSIGNVESDDYEEVFRTASISGNRCEGFSTAPSSPSLNSHSSVLGASLSLSNISGIGARTEVKKRRAPPPPEPTSPIVAVEKTPEDMSTGPLYAAVQKEEQKKKRRAPPPPTSQMPNQKHKDLENRKSYTGNGREVPQKPPRGNSRSPPQLMIPPPPPYPPPDHDIVDPPVFENGAPLTGPTRPIPAKREKHLSLCNSVSSEELLTTDDAGSVNSYREDSGIVSSPSDNTSLDLQIHSSKRKDKIEKQLNECKTPTGNVHPARAGSFNSDDSWRLNTSSIRTEDEVALVKDGEEEHFIAEQFQKTLAELDEDSEDMDDGDIGERNHIGTRSSPVGEESSHYNDSSEHSTAVPVTVIDEVPEINTLKYNPRNLTTVKEYSKIFNSSAVSNRQSINKPPEVEKIEKKNSQTYKIPQPTSQEVKLKAEHLKLEENHSTSNMAMRNNSQKQSAGKESQSSNTVASSIKVFQETRQTKEKSDILPEKIQIKENHASSNVHKITEPSKPVLRRQQTYEAKAGMTTFTVVPPKPDIRKYDREVSISASAIKIDDQGNLISPQSSFDKKDTKNNIINESEGTLIEKPLLEKAKEFWRSNSMEPQVMDSKEQTIKKLDTIKSYRPNQALENKVNPTSVMGFIQEIPGNKVNDTNNQLLMTKSATAPEKIIIIENTSKGRTNMVKSTVHDKFNGVQQTKSTKGPSENRSIIESTIKEKTNLQSPVNEMSKVSQHTKPVYFPAASQERVTIEQPNMERKDLPFLKSSKRTSSQYVASAISKYTEPVDIKAEQTSEAKQNTNCGNSDNILKNNRNFIAEKPKVEVNVINKEEVSADWKKNFSNSNDGNIISRNLQIEPTSKMNSDGKQGMAFKIERSLSEQNGLIGSQSIWGNTSVTKRTSINYSTPESSRLSRPISGLPLNAFLKAVREKSGKIEENNSIVYIKAAPATAATPEIEEKHEVDNDVIPSTVIDEPDNPSDSNIFGPKARFRPIVQKPMQKDTSVHSALMGAIQSGEGKEKLRKIQNSPTDGDERKFAEPENERSALLSAIRAHNGISRLKKVSSTASDELQTLRSIETLQNNDFVGMNTSIPPPPCSPPPPPPSLLNTTAKSPATSLNSSVDAREELLAAIRSGAGASRLKKVSASVRTL
ncbi:protein cordon-bleu isoform X1 [Ranitomeya imitator]|uniref:protein cordon-bleu isoform X1 n=1 Tax=Ranitomeya imitator TaxID=111125 RepID=UPI0037E86091